MNHSIYNNACMVQVMFKFEKKTLQLGGNEYHKFSEDLILYKSGLWKNEGGSE